MQKTLFILFLVFLALASGSARAEELVSAEVVVKNLKAHQALIRDLSADFYVSKQPSRFKEERILRAGKIWIEGENAKISFSSPETEVVLKQKNRVSVIDQKGDLVFWLNPSYLETLLRLTPLTSLPPDPFQYLDQLNFRVGTLEADKYVLIGHPKHWIPGIAKVIFYVDKYKYLPLRMTVLNEKEGLSFLAEITYKTIGGIWVPYKFHSLTTLPGVTVLDVTVKYDKIKINQGISERHFKL